jgi:hypothetical protein
MKAANRETYLSLNNRRPLGHAGHERRALQRRRPVDSRYATVSD